MCKEYIEKLNNESKKRHEVYTKIENDILKPALENNDLDQVKSAFNKLLQAYTDDPNAKVEPYIK